MSEEEEIPEIDFGSIINDVKRYAKSALLVGAATSALVLWPVINATPKYTSNGVVMLDSRSYKDTPNEDVVSNLPSDTTQVDTEVEVLKSTQLAEKVISDLQLDKDPEFNPFLNINQKKSEFSIFPKKDLSHVEEGYRKQQVVQNVLKNLTVKRQGLTRVIDVSFKSKNPDTAAKITESWINNYLLEQVQAKISGTQKANELVGLKLNELRQQVETANNEVEGFKLANGILSSDGKDLAAQEISNYSQQVTLAKASYAEAQAKLDTAKAQIAKGSHGEDLGEALNSEVIQNLRKLRADVSSEYEKLNTKYGPKHPDIIRVRNQLSDIDRQISAEIGRIVSNLTTQAQVQSNRLASLQASLNAAQDKLARNNLASAKLNELQTNADSIRALYESYLNKYKETAAAEGNAQADARIISHANLPTEPSEPKIPLGIAIALMAGLFSAFATILVRKFMDKGVNSADEVERTFKEPLLGTIPTVASTLKSFKGFNGTPIEYVQQNPLSPFAEAFRSLRASLIYSASGEAVKIIAVTSALPGEGKTSTSLCLAQTIASSGQKVLIVDCDLRKHTISNAISNPKKLGLLEYVNGNAKLEDVVLTDKAGINYITLNKGSFTAKDVFGSENMDKVLAELKENFDIVILDTAPVIPVVDSRILARKADATVLLTRWQKTPKEITQDAIGILKDTGVKLSGIALTQVNIKQASSYSYGTHKYYGKHYGGYYK